MFDKIKWATALPKKLHKPPHLHQLKNLVSYRDRSGRLAKLIGERVKKGKKYLGASAIFELGRHVKNKSARAENKVERGDQAALLFNELQMEAQSWAKEGRISLALKLEGCNPSKLVNIFNRFANVPGFPLSLPDSEEELCELFGSAGGNLSKRSALRSAINFYIKFYGEITQEAQRWLADRILASLPEESQVPRSLRAWWEARQLIFSKEAPEKIAQKYRENPENSFELFANEIGISNHSGLFASSRLEVTCQELAALPHKIGRDEEKVIRKVLSEKNEKIDQNWVVAAKCLQILVNRSINESEGIPPDSWAEVIVQLGCHPDREISGRRHQRFWHWANKHQRNTARLAFVRRDLEVVLEYIMQAAEEGQKDGHMVAPRISFYKKLLAKGLLRDSRLFVGPRVHQSLSRKIKSGRFWDLHKHPDRDLCILALKLADGVNLTTGTKSFPMRFYGEKSGQFQLIWESFSNSRSEPTFGNEYFSHSHPTCVYQKHVVGWQEKVINEILPSKRFRVYWSHYKLV